MTLQIDLVKKTELVLEKKGFNNNIQAKVCIILDESGSMETLFNNGTVGRIVDRALAIGYKFDDDGEIDVWSFSGTGKFVKRPGANQGQYGSYLKHKMLGGSTVYHQVLREVGKDYYSAVRSNVVTKKAGLISKLFFGAKDETVVEKVVADPSDLPAFVIFITDGAPDSDSDAINNIRKILKDFPKMFVQFIGVGRNNFPVLEVLANSNENAAFSTILPSDSDEDVLDKFLNTKARKTLEG